MNKNLKRVTDYDDLPLILDVPHIQQIMGIAKVSAYALVHSEGFPLIRRGRLIKVSKRAFFEWLERGEAACSHK